MQTKNKHKKKQRKNMHKKKQTQHKHKKKQTKNIKKQAQKKKDSFGIVWFNFPRICLLKASFSARRVTRGLTPRWLPGPTKAQNQWRVAAKAERQKKPRRFIGEKQRDAKMFTSKSEKLLEIHGILVYISFL